MTDQETGTPPPPPSSASPRPAGPAGGSESESDLLSLAADGGEASEVFRHTALLTFGEAALPLRQAFAVLQAMALEDGRCYRELDRGELFQAEAAALAEDLRVAQTRAAHLALQGPLDPASASQVRTCAVMVEVARELRTLRQRLEAANA